MKGFWLFLGLCILSGTIFYCTEKYCKTTKEVAEKFNKDKSAYRYNLIPSAQADAYFDEDGHSMFPIFDSYTGKVLLSGNFVEQNMQHKSIVLGDSVKDESNQLNEFATKD